jgi:hypothetical protein
MSIECTVFTAENRIHESEKGVCVKRWILPGCRSEFSLRGEIDLA